MQLTFKMPILVRAMMRMTIMALCIAVTSSSPVMSNRDSLRGSFENRGYNAHSSGDRYYDPGYQGDSRAEVAVVRINGQEEDIDLRHGTSGQIARPDTNIESIELISGPPNFGFFLSSRTDKRFVSETVNWNEPKVKGPPKYSPSRSSSNMNPFKPVFSPTSSKFLLEQADRLFYYTLEDPREQVVTVVESVSGRANIKVMNYQRESQPRYSVSAMMNEEKFRARWKFSKRIDVKRIAVVQAPRGRLTECKVKNGFLIEGVKIGMPLVQPVYGVRGLVCFR